jgi:hypothetical protein
MKNKYLLFLFLVLFLFVPKEAQASEFMFESLKAFGKLNGYLAGLIVILQCIIVYSLAVNILLKALEMLSNPDMSNLVVAFLGNIMTIILIVNLPKMIINMVRGITFNGQSVGSGYTSATAYINELAQSNGFSFIFNFIKTINIVIIIIFGLMAVISFGLATMNYLANLDLSSYIRHIVVTILFVMVALSFNNFTLTKSNIALDGTEVSIISVNNENDLLKLSNINFKNTYSK